MTLLFRLMIALVGISNLLIGLAFLGKPTDMASSFFVEPVGAQGIASLRADFTAFFLVAGIYALIGAWRMQSKPLRVPALLLGIAFVGRLVNLFQYGVMPNSFPPMLVEALMVLILIGGMQTFRTPAKR